MTADEAEIQGAQSEIGEAIQRVLDEKAPVPADDTRLIARLVVDKRVHCVSDEAVMALARRVLELEAKAALLEPAAKGWAEIARRTEREACAKAAEQEVGSWWGEARRTIGVKVVEAIRARGGK